MAFGSSMKAQTASASGSGEKKTFINQWLDPQRGLYRTGRRVFRILPMVDDEGVMIPGEDGRGITSDEVRWAEFWIPVIDNGRQRQQRVIVDWKNPFNNPVWERLYADLPKETPEGKPNPKRVLPKQRFAINVLDRTKVLYGPNGEVLYPNEQDKYFILENNIPKEVKGTPTVHNQVRILEGSTGKAGGKHMLQQLLDYVDSVSDPTDESERKLYLHEFDLALKVTGENQDTRRSFQLASNFKPLTAEQLALPRYDIAAWATPWPNEALDALLDGEPFNEVIERYPNIVLYPSLPQDDQEILF